MYSHNVHKPHLHLSKQNVIETLQMTLTGSGTLTRVSLRLIKHDIRPEISATQHYCENILKEQREQN